MTVAKQAKSASTAAVAAEPVKQCVEAVAVQKETIESVAPAAAEVVPPTPDKAGIAAFKGYEDILQFNKDTVDAFVKSSTIVAKGVQDLSKSIVTLAQESIEESMTAGKAFIGAKTFKEVVDLSSALAKANFDKLVVESNRLGQLSAKLAEEALVPISKRVGAVVEKLTKTAA